MLLALGVDALSMMIAILIIMLLTMASSSLTIYHLNQLFSHFAPQYLVGSAFFLFVAVLLWAKTLKIAVAIHEVTEDALDEDLRDALIDGALDDSSADASSSLNERTVDR